MNFAEKFTKNNTGKIESDKINVVLKEMKEIADQLSEAITLYENLELKVKIQGILATLKDGVEKIEHSNSAFLRERYKLENYTGVMYDLGLEKINSAIGELKAEEVSDKPLSNIRYTDLLKKVTEFKNLSETRGTEAQQAQNSR